MTAILWSRWSFSTAVLAILVVLGAASCGRKTDPLTPDSPRPEAIKDIKAVSRDAIAFLSWRIPVKNVEGREMDPAGIREFRIYRAELGRDRKIPRYRQIAAIDREHPSPAEVRNGSVFWSDRTLRYGQVYSYRIRVVSTGGGVSSPSEEVRIAPLLSLAQPKHFTAVGGDSHVLLNWDTVDTRSDGSRYDGFVAYNLYRGAEKGRFEETPLNKEPLRTTSYKDTSVQNDKAYFYLIRAVDSPAQPWKESLDSEEASATPRDMTAPEKPSGLTVVPGLGRIFLTWNENRERDLAGYHVYRSTKSGREYVRLTDKPVNRTTFSDETAETGTTFYYVVTAVDKAGNESQPSREQKAFAEATR